MHPILKALRERQWTQQELVDSVNRTKPRSANGKRIRLTQGYLSSVISEKATKQRYMSVPMAEAVAKVLGINAADILLFKRAPADKKQAHPRRVA